MKEAGRSLVATAIAHFINDGLLNLLPLLYLFFLKSYGLTQIEVGVLASFTSVFAVIASPFIGRRSDASQNYGVLLTLGIVLISIGMFGYGLSVFFLNGFALFVFLLIMTLFFGIGSSFYHPLGAAILNETWDAPVRGRAMGINGSMGAVGVTIFPVIANALILSLAFPSIAFLGVAGIILAFVIFMIMKSFQFSKLRQVVGESKKENRMQAISLKSLLPIILPLTVVAFLRGLMQGAVQFLAIYIQTVKSVNIAYVGIAFGIMPAMGAFSQPMFGYFSDRFGRRLAIAISAVGMALSFVLFLGISNIIVSEVFLALFGLFNYTSFPLLMGVATEISPKGSTTIGSSIVWGVGTIGGGAIGPLLVAFFALPGVLGSLTWAFFALTIISLTSIVFLPFIYRRQAVRANTREEIAVP